MYYCGTEEQWNDIYFCEDNAPLLNATIHFLVENEHTHFYTSVIIPPTCTSHGYTTYTCECGDSYIDNYVDPSHTPKTITVPATCTVAGMIYNVCETCGETIGNSTVIPATGHNYVGTVTTPTCTANGYTTYKCACGDTYVCDETSALGHTYGDTVEENYVVTTCVENGSKDLVVYCSVCNDEISRETVTLKAIGHNYVDGNCEYCGEKDPTIPDEPEYNYTFSIQTPSTSSIRHKDGIKLHADIEGTALAGSYVVWTASNSNFKTEEINNGNSLKIVSDKNGTTIFTATLYSTDGEILATDSIEMKSKAGFFDKIGSFFRSLFGGTKIYEN